MVVTSSLITPDSLASLASVNISRLVGAAGSGVASIIGSDVGVVVGETATIGRR